MSEPGEVLEVCDGGVATPSLEVAHEGGPVGRGEHQMGVADNHVVFRIASVLGELGRGSGEKAPCEPGREANPGLGDLTPCTAEDVQGLGIVEDFDPDPFEEHLGVGLDQREPFFAHHLDRGQRSW